MGPNLTRKGWIQGTDVFSWYKVIECQKNSIYKWTQIFYLPDFWADCFSKCSYIVCHVLYLHVCLCTTCMHYPQKPAVGTGVTDSCSNHVGPRNKTSALWSSLFSWPLNHFSSPKARHFKSTNQMVAFWHSTIFWKFTDCFRNVMLLLPAGFDFEPYFYSYEA